MSLASCPKCWDTPCRCGHEYESWNVKDLDDQIAMLQRVRASKEPLMDPAPNHMKMLVEMLMAARIPHELVEPQPDGTSVLGIRGDDVPDGNMGYSCEFVFKPHHQLRQVYVGVDRIYTYELDADEAPTPLPPVEAKHLDDAGKVFGVDY